MFKPISVAIGLRYLRAKRRSGFISFISLASILAITIGTMALITTLAVISGFQRDIRDSMLQMAAHATISAAGEPMQNWQQAIAIARTDARIAGAAPYIQTQALLSGPRREPAVVRGVLPDAEPQVSVLAEKMTEGTLDSLQQGSFNIILGRDLALWLGVRAGDQVVVTTDFQATPMGAIPQLKRFTVSGIFAAGREEFDRGLAVVNMHDLQRVTRMGEGVTGVRLKLHDMNQSFDVAEDLALQLGGLYHVSDWSRENAGLFNALKLEKTMLGILLSLLIVMGGFNLVSSQVMLVTDKQADIAILRTLGLTPRAVMQVFMVQGTVIGVIGTVLGVIGGILLTLNLERILRVLEQVLDRQLIPSADNYYISGLPIDLNPMEVALVAGMALLMAFLATIYPAWRAARTPPAEALRYE